MADSGGFAIYRCQFESKRGNLRFEVYMASDPDDPPPDYKTGHIYSSTNRTRRRGGKRIFCHLFMSDPSVSPGGLDFGIADRMSPMASNAEDWVSIMAVRGAVWEHVPEPSVHVKDMLSQVLYLGGRR